MPRLRERRQNRDAAIEDIFGDFWDYLIDDTRVCTCYERAVAEGVVQKLKRLSCLVDPRMTGCFSVPAQCSPAVNRDHRNGPFDLDMGRILEGFNTTVP